MQQVKGKCAAARWFTTLVLFTLFAAGLANGQTEQPVRFSIPYGFTVGSKTLPAGTYTFSISTQLSRLTVASDATGSLGMNVVSWMSGPNELFQGGSLVFEKTKDELVLSEVWLSGTDGALIHPVPKGHDRIVVSGSVLDDNRSYSGKTAFNLTCARCHGENGKGNADADKFFGVKIPRLTSAEVQAKSDAELKHLIMQGSSVMPPVEIDESGFRHRLPSQDVDAVIAYVRTLKH